MNPIETKTLTCGTCGQLFEGWHFSGVGCGVKLAASQLHCDPCIEAAEARINAQTQGSLSLARPAWEEICPQAYQGFDAMRLPIKSCEVAAKAFAWQPGPKGVGLIGDSRAGKTFIMHELARRIYENGGKIKLTSGTEFAYACGSGEAGERRAMIDSCISVPHLFLDDIDKMKMTDRVESDFYHVIEQRRRALKPVFVTLNASGAELERMMSATGGSPIVNRLRHDVCEFMAV